MNEPIKIKPPRVKHDYIDKKKFHFEMTKYRIAAIEAEANGRDKPRVNNYIGNCFILICENLGRRPNFANYSYREEMVNDGIENCLAAVDNFDPSEQKQNPFGYFSLIAWRAFVRRIQKENKHNYIKHKSIQNSGIMNELYHSDGGHFDAINDVSSNDVSDRVVSNFEAKMEAKKKPTKITGVEKFLGED